MHQCAICGNEFDIDLGITEDTEEKALHAAEIVLEGRPGWALHDHVRSAVWGYSPVIGIRTVAKN
jgi:hypothetical protein